MRSFPLAVFAAALFAFSPAYAADPAPATPTTAASPAAEAPASTAPVAATADPGASEARVSKMRGRWQRMTPEQREEMRQKAERRLQERYERLSPQEQSQVDSIAGEVAKLSREQRSIFLAKIHQKSYQERNQKKLMKDQESKPMVKPVEAPKAPEAPVVTPASSETTKPAH